MHCERVRLCSHLGKWARELLAPSSVTAERLRCQAFKLSVIYSVSQFVSHFQNLCFIQLVCKNSWFLPDKTFYGRSPHSANFRQNFQFRVNARRKANTKYTFLHLKLEESDPYIPENQFISPKQINLYLQSELICQKCIHKMLLFVLILLAHLIFSSPPSPGWGRRSN